MTLRNVIGIFLLLVTVIGCSKQNPVSINDTENSKIAATSTIAFTPQGEIVVAKSTLGTHAGRLYLVAKGSDNSVWSRIQDGVNGGWTSAWTRVGNAGQAAGNIEIINGKSDNRLYLFTKDANKKIKYLMQRSSGGWISAWGNLASNFTCCNITDDIAVGTQADNSIIVFASGNYGYINAIKMSDNTFTDIGGQQYNRRLVVGKNADGRLEVFVATSGEARCQHKWQISANGGWAPYWEDLFSDINNTLSDLVVANNQDGRLELFLANSFTQQINHTWQTQASNSQSWVTMTPLEPFANVKYGLNVGRNSDGRLEIFFHGNNTSNTCYHAWQVSPNSDWSNNEYLLPDNSLSDMPDASKIAVGNYDDGRLAVFAIGTASGVFGIHVKYQTGPTSWSSWQPLTN